MIEVPQLDDKAEFAEFCSACDAMDLLASQRDQLLDCMAGLLHLGLAATPGLPAPVLVAGLPAPVLVAAQACRSRRRVFHVPSSCCEACRPLSSLHRRSTK